jgi:nitrogen fixation protein NifT
LLGSPPQADAKTVFLLESYACFRDGRVRRIDASSASITLLPMSAASLSPDGDSLRVTTEDPLTRKNGFHEIMIRRSPETGLSIYVPKKDLEEPIIESQHETLWGGWIRIANGWVLDLPEMAPDTQLPITVNARKCGDGEEES